MGGGGVGEEGGCRTRKVCVCVRSNNTDDNCTRHSRKINEPEAGVVGSQLGKTNRNPPNLRYVGALL